LYFVPYATVTRKLSVSLCVFRAPLHTLLSISVWYRPVGQAKKIFNLFIEDFA
jgi:hypothetical protein